MKARNFKLNGYKNPKRCLFIVFLAALSLVYAQNTAFSSVQLPEKDTLLAFKLPDMPWSDAYKQKKLQEQQEKEEERMVHTVQEWQERATDIKMEHRFSEPYKEPPNPKLVEKLDWQTFFEKYNSAPGSREFNLEKLQAEKSARSIGVISPDFKLMAYTECYFHPSSRQTASAFYIYPLDTAKGKKQRVLEANVFSGAKKTPLLSTTNETLKTALFSSFTVVDWSKDNTRVLLKEKIGSAYDGIYQTNIWVYFLNPDKEEGKGAKANDSTADTPDTSAKNASVSAIYPHGRKYDRLHDTIKQYWFYTDRLNLNRYRWDVKPLGFLAENENLIICVAHTYDTKNREHIFLGSWSVDVLTGEVNLLSTMASDNFEIATNGLVIIKRLPSRF